MFYKHAFLVEFDVIGIVGLNTLFALSVFHFWSMNW